MGQGPTVKLLNIDQYLDNTSHISRAAARSFKNFKIEEIMVQESDRKCKFTCLFFKKNQTVKFLHIQYLHITHSFHMQISDF